MKEYGIGIEITQKLSNGLVGLHCSALDRLRAAQNDAFELQTLAVLDPERYRAIILEREVLRWATLSWKSKVCQVVRTVRERIALWIAPWLDIDSYD